MGKKKSDVKCSKVVLRVESWGKGGETMEKIAELWRTKSINHRVGGGRAFVEQQSPPGDQFWYYHCCLE